jgi:hypothetical protein
MINDVLDTKHRGGVERESAQRAAAREEPAVQERESRQRAMARFNKTFKMACKYVNGQYTYNCNELPESSQRAPREHLVCKQTIPVWNYLSICSFGVI